MTQNTADPAEAKNNNGSEIIKIKAYCSATEYSLPEKDQ